MMENPASAGWSPAGSVDHRPVSAPEAAQTRASDLPKRPNDAKLTSEPGVIWRIPDRSVPKSASNQRTGCFPRGGAPGESGLWYG